jgi:hypothetical protein
LKPSRAEVLAAIADLLQRDLQKITLEQRKAASEALKDEPSHWTLASAIRQWAAALADACRSYAARYAEILVDFQEPNPVTTAQGHTLLDLLGHLRLRGDLSVLFDEWPEAQENAVRDFILELSGARMQINVDAKSVIRPLLPRWDRGMHLLVQPQDPFLSEDESSEVLRNLERAFCYQLWEDLGSAWESEAVLASYRRQAGTSAKSQATFISSNAQHRTKGRQKSKFVAMRNEVIWFVAATGARGERYCQALDEKNLQPPLEWQKRDGCPNRYVAAWNHPTSTTRSKWRKRIADEKYKATRSLAKTHALAKSE